ncbi:MAG: sugar ABC transporter substrate-binding protein [Bacillota bacterium]
MKKIWLVQFICMVFLFILIVLMVTFLKKDDRPRMVVVLKQSNIEYWKIIEAGAEKAFDDFNIDGEVIAPDSEYSSITQINMLKNVLKRHPDALIVAPTHPSATIPVLKEYKEKNIPTLMVDTDAGWEDQTTYIGTDHYVLGKKAGELLGSMLQPRDQVAFIGGMSVSSVTNERIKGAKEALEAIGVEIVTEQTGYDSFGKVKSVMGKILQSYPNIQGVFATDDVMALNALRIIEKKGLKIPVIGTDGTVEILKVIEEEGMSATVAQNPYDMGYISVEQALRAIKGEHVEKRIDSGVDILTVDNAKDRMNFLTKILKFKGNSLLYGIPPNILEYGN